VPKIDDDDIVELCQKYPKIHNDEDEAKNVEELKGGPLQM